MTTKPLMTIALLALSAATAACSATPAHVLPTRIGAAPSPDLTLVWVGRGKAERLEGASWQRAESFDYEFTVEQRRYANHWESVKHLKRLHPDYDGSAGPREQTMYFRLALGEVDAQGAVPVAIESSLGEGDGRADRQFRSASMVMHPEISSFAPFDTYRIQQSYEYENGKLLETVHLDKGTSHWVRNQEEAKLFASSKFAEPPTRR